MPAKKTSAAKKEEVVEEVKEDVTEEVKKEVKAVKPKNDKPVHEFKVKLGISEQKTISAQGYKVNIENLGFGDIDVDGTKLCTGDSTAIAGADKFTMVSKSRPTALIKFYK